MIMDDALTNNASRKGLASLRPWLTTNACEQPLALQLGGGGLGGVSSPPTADASKPYVSSSSSSSSPVDISSIERLASAASLSLSYASSFGASPFSELNLNCGCPSDSAKKRGFGADLMRPISREHTIRAVSAVVRQVGHELPVTVKCRIGVIARSESASSSDHNRVGYAQLTDFVSDMSTLGIRRMIVHCRVCVLCGLTTGENRSVPPLRRYVVNGLTRDFPEMEFVVNGGVTSLDEAEGLLGFREESGGGRGWRKADCDDERGEEGKERSVFCTCGKRTLYLGDDDDWSTAKVEGKGASPSTSNLEQHFPKGVMIGRWAHNDVASFWDADSRFYGASNRNPTMRTVVEEYVDYAEKVISSEGFGGKEDDEVEEGGENNSLQSSHLRPRTRNSNIPTLTKPLHNLFTGATGNRFFKRKLDTLLKECRTQNGDDSGLFEELVWEAIKGNVDDFLDASLSESRRGAGKNDSSGM